MNYDCTNAYIINRFNCPYIVFNLIEFFATLSDLSAGERSYNCIDHLQHSDSILRCERYQDPQHIQF